MTSDQWPPPKPGPLPRPGCGSLIRRHSHRVDRSSQARFTTLAHTPSRPPFAPTYVNFHHRPTTRFHNRYANRASPPFSPCRLSPDDHSPTTYVLWPHHNLSKRPFCEVLYYNPSLRFPTKPNFDVSPPQLPRSRLRFHNPCAHRSQHLAPPSLPPSQTLRDRPPRSTKRPSSPQRRQVHATNTPYQVFTSLSTHKPRY